MLSRKFKLPVQGFSEDGKTIFRGEVIMVKSSLNDLGHFRVGVVVSRGVVSGAIARNSIKRTIFNFFKDRKMDLMNFNKDMLIIFKPNKGERDFYPKLEQDLNKFFLKIKR